ncbi:MAM and LDL-receptor class A domain-containing protein 1-like [Anneissia japonica]|uniref:MAM and LDL-receptor class A domain-containing protein 1-like n=1 Tax=Anneissia japonica TaxID=1529436 RepID=UPI0014258A26|nr:MAM and LDL-receptor class A domain-containing protein 1-like [Anneissia japonica]
MLLFVKQLYAIIIFVLLFSSWLIENVLCYEQVFSCDFETGSNCTFKQWYYPSDNFDWTQWQGSTGGAYSGPSSDHTYGNISGNYMYTQSNADKRGENAILQIGEKLKLSAGRGVLRFYYHMEDRDGPDSLGDLKVYGCYQGGRNIGEPMWTRSKSQGDKWLMAEIVYECRGEFQVLFEGIRGTRDSDIAIDDILLLDLSIDGRYI